MSNDFDLREHANNEVGTIQPIEKISRLAHEHKIIVHTDAAQSVGKIQTQVDPFSVDLLSLRNNIVFLLLFFSCFYFKLSVYYSKLVINFERFVK
jgi:cysteine desulfurase